MTSPISSATSTSGDAHLAEQNRVLDVVLSSIADCAYTFDREHRFTYANKPLLELFGLRLDEVVGRTFQQLPYPPELAARLDEQIDVVLARAEKVRGETFFASPSGQNGWFDYIFAPVMNAEGRVVSVAGSTRDITARVEQEHRLEALAASERAARAAAEQANRVKDEFLARLGHELRTPLNAILGWSELLASGRITGEQVKDAAERISRNARSQALLIADLLHQGTPPATFAFGGYWLDIGRPDDYDQANAQFEELQYRLLPQFRVQPSLGPLAQEDPACAS